MTRFIDRGRLAAVLLLAGFLMAALSAVVVRAQSAEDLKIRTPDGVQQEAFIEIGGAPQWVTIRGEHRANPVILLVGGAGTEFGSAFSPYVRTFRCWERDFTVVQWDMQGAGKTFAKAGRQIPPGVGLDRLTADGLALTDELRRRLGKRRIVVLGVSGGSTVALRMVEARPDAFSAFVSSGLVASSTAVREQFFLDRLIRKVKDRGDPADLATVARFGADPLQDPERRKLVFTLGARYRPPNPTDQVTAVLAAPNWSLDDALALRAGQSASWDRFGATWQATDWGRLGADLRIPVVLIYGEDNDIQPTPTARAWLDRIRAPRKLFVTIPVAGNHVMETHPEAFLRLLDLHVRPLALAAEARP